MATMPAVEYAVVATSSEHEQADLGALGHKLEKRGVKILTTTSAAHEALMTAQVTHEHVIRAEGRMLSLLEQASIVVASLADDVDPAGARHTSPEQQAIAALIRAAALRPDAFVVVTNADHFPVCYRGAVGVAIERRRALAAHALRYLVAHDSVRVRALAGATEATKQTVLVVGGGGREHAIASKLCASPRVAKVIVVPGNGGTLGGKMESVGGVSELDNLALVQLAQTRGVNLVVVGPETPLVNGLSDAMRAAGIPCFGPSALAARLEGSKAFSKAFMERHEIPTARYAAFTDHAAALRHLESVTYPVVIKASGLAAGKGVVLPETTEEAKNELARMMVDSAFGDAGKEVVIEERLTGEEVSVLAFCDGAAVTLMPGAQDHKRVFDKDMGPNTGGMGAYAPAPILAPVLKASVALEVIQRAVDGALIEGFPFQGVLYAGIIVTPDGPRVLEFNCRFGDPETQVILPLLESDLFEIMMRCTCGTLLAQRVRFSKAHCAGVVLAAKGYPGAYAKGAPLKQGAGLPDSLKVFHAGTAVQEGTVVSSGGRVLAVTASQPTLKEALAVIYKTLDSGAVGFDEAHFRRDIGQRALRPPIRLGVLGSTRGTDLQYIIDAIENGWLRAEIKVVVSNKKDAYIVTRARDHDLHAVVHSMKGCATRADFDNQVTATLKEHEVDLVLLIGYMRILSDEFVDAWFGKVFNVHPSLLPEFAGGMDLNVHQAVLDAGKSESGCTIHLVTREVDGGPIIVQRRCPVYADDDSDKLKARVQALEGPAFFEAIQIFVQTCMPDVQLA